MTALACAALIAASAWLLVPAGATGRLERLTALPTVERPTLLDRLAARARRRGDPDLLRRRAVIGALAALAAELRAGQPPPVALVAAEGAEDAWPAGLAAVRMDADVAAALREDGVRAPAVRSLAACWEVSAHTGAGLTAAVEQLAATARAAEEIRGQLATQLAGPRATAKTLALLPVIGLVMGQLAGVDPLGWLLTTPMGLVCLAAGIGLDVLGLLWTRRIATRIEEQL